MPPDEGHPYNCRCPDIYDGLRWLSLCETDLEIEDIDDPSEASLALPPPKAQPGGSSVNNDQNANNETPKVIALDKAQTKRTRRIRQARPRAVNRKSAKKPRVKIGRVQRLRNRIERLETRIAKLRSRITVNEGRLAKVKARLEKAVSAAATSKSQKKARSKRAAAG
jgi:hypothetical protein